MTDFIRSDLGLQPERVELAWRRTFLSMTVLIGLGIRATQQEFGLWSAVLGGVSFALIAYAAAMHRRRAKQQLIDFHSNHRISRLDALPIALVGLAVLAISVSAAVWFLLRLAN